jgi:hypothetical protein
LKWESVKDLDAEAFRRLTGIKKPTFVKMSGVLSQAHRAKQARGGRRPKLSIEEQLLMSLEYLREYRTYFHKLTQRLLIGLT